MADPTPLEVALSSAHLPGSDMRPALGAFMNGNVILASVAGGAQLEGFQPLVISNGENGYLCVFSSTERITALLGAATDHVFAEMRGLDVVRGSTTGLGIAINPGSEGLEISPSIVEKLKATLQ